MGWEPLELSHAQPAGLSVGSASHGHIGRNDVGSTLHEVYVHASFAELADGHQRPGDFGRLEMEVMSFSRSPPFCKFELTWPSLGTLAPLPTMKF